MPWPIRPSPMNPTRIARPRVRSSQHSDGNGEGWQATIAEPYCEHTEVSRAMSTISPRAGKPATQDMLIDVARLEREYFARRPDPDVPAERVSFGTSGHRGSSLLGSFNEAHILAITQAICEHRRARGVEGPLYLGKDTHALSN